MADTKSGSTRVPLRAGNWKMNLNHQEAVVLVQKLAWTLSDKKHDYRRVEVVVVQDRACIELMREFIAAHPHLWNEDIGR